MSVARNGLTSSDGRLVSSGGELATNGVVASVNSASVVIVTLNVGVLVLPAGGGIARGNFALARRTRSRDGSKDTSAGDLAVTGVGGAEVVVRAYTRLVFASSDLRNLNTPAEADVADLVETTLGSGRTVNGLVSVGGGSIFVDERVDSSLHDDGRNGGSSDLVTGLLLIGGDIDGDGDGISDEEELAVSRLNGLILGFSTESKRNAVRVRGNLSNTGRANTTILNTSVNGTRVVVVAANGSVGTNAGGFVTVVVGTIVTIIALARLATRLGGGRREVRIARDGFGDGVVGVPATEMSDYGGVITYVLVSQVPAAS